jgi:hypothetical protein
MQNEDPSPGPEFVRSETGNDSLSGPSDKKLLMSERWHRPYAEALMESDPKRRERLIADAERHIFRRYLELCAAPGPAECRDDLENATKVLREMKRKRVLRHGLD